MLLAFGPIGEKKPDVLPEGACGPLEFGKGSRLPGRVPEFLRHADQVRQRDEPKSSDLPIWP